MEKLKDSNYLNNAFLLGTAENRLRVCMMDQRFSLKHILGTQDPQPEDRLLPRILYGDLSSGNDDSIQLEIRIKLKKEFSTCEPKLTRVIWKNTTSPWVKPLSLCRDLNDYVSNVIGKSGQLVLILNRLQDLSHRQVAFLSNELSYPTIQFGIILATHPEYIKEFKEKSPQYYSNFLNAIDCPIRSNGDIIRIINSDDFMSATQAMKARYMAKFF